MLDAGIRQKRIRQKGSTNEAPAPVRSLLVLCVAPQLAERWMQQGSTKQAGPSVLSTEIW